MSAKTTMHAPDDIPKEVQEHYEREAERRGLLSSGSPGRPDRWIHVLPVGDEEMHAAQETCWCHPTEIEPGLWVHNAKDCREARERATGEKCSDGWINIAEYVSPRAFSPITMDNTQQGVPPEVAQTKQFRADLDEVLQRLKSASDTQRERTVKCVVRGSRERSIAITKIQEAIMWLGMDLKAWREEHEDDDRCPSPYPQSYNPESPAIEPTADRLKL